MKKSRALAVLWIFLFSAAFCILWCSATQGEISKTIKIELDLARKIERVLALKYSIRMNLIGGTAIPGTGKSSCWRYGFDQFKPLNEYDLKKLFFFIMLETLNFINNFEPVQEDLACRPMTLENLTISIWNYKNYPLVCTPPLPSYILCDRGFLSIEFKTADGKVTKKAIHFKELCRDFLDQLPNHLHGVALRELLHDYGDRDTLKKRDDYWLNFFISKSSEKSSNLTSKSNQPSR